MFSHLRFGFVLVAAFLMVVVFVGLVITYTVEAFR